MIIDSGVVTGSLQVSGSLSVTGSSNFQGDVSITGSLSVSGPISGAITGSITNAVSASYALSASYAVSASRAVSADSATTASLATTNLYTASVSNNIITFTEGDGTTFSLTVATGSGTNTVSASRATSAANADNATLFNSLSSSQFPQLVQNNTFTGNNIFGNITGSNAQFNSASIVYLSVIYQTSSIVYSSGSNQLGDASNDTQTLWGRVDLPSGPLTVTGSINASGGITGSLDGSNLVAASVANAKLANSTISGIALGSNLATLTIGTGLSGTSYNGSTAVTIANTGVTSNVAGTGVTVSGATGAVTISIGQAVGTSSNVQFNSLGVGTAGSGTAGEIRATADVTAFYSSDERLKEDITSIENPIEKLMAINGVTFNWKEGFDEIHSHKGADTGVIAQQIEAIGLPDVVTTRENGFKAVKYEKLNALLIEGFKVQQTLIHSQQSQIDELKTLVNQLLNK